MVRDHEVRGSSPRCYTLIGYISNYETHTGLIVQLRIFQQYSIFMLNLLNMNRSELIFLLNNTDTVRSVKKYLGGLHENLHGTNKMMKICADLDIDFNQEFAKNIVKHNNCNECGLEIKLNKKYCDSSCAAKYNNRNRKHSEDTKNKIRDTITRKYRAGEITIKNRSIKGHRHRNSNIYNKELSKYVYICANCGNEFMTDKPPSEATKNCSKKCSTSQIFNNRRYRNGSRKTFYYYNKHTSELVTLESTWEVTLAEFLDRNNINWIRPNSIVWIDHENKERLYYPDFYLKDYDLYVDPKNPYCMKRDAYKMQYIENRNNIIYGDVQYLLNDLKQRCALD